MRKIVLIIIGLLAIFSYMRAYSEEGDRQFSIHPGTVSFADENSQISVGFGVLESAGQESRVWNIFPVKLSLKTEKQSFYLALNGLSFLTGSGIHFETPLTVTGVRKEDVISFGGPVKIIGKVEGDVWVFGADVTLEPKGEVLGEVVVLGGSIIEDRQSVIRGNKHSLPELKIPFLGLLSSKNSIQTIRFILELINIVFFLLLLFLVLFFRKDQLGSRGDQLFSSWKEVLLVLLGALIFIPLLTILLMLSIVGIVLIPFLFVALILVAYQGFLAVVIKMGRLFIKEGDSMGRYYLSGLMGLLLLKGPALLGILLSLLNAKVIVTIGGVLTTIASIVLILAHLYGFGFSLTGLREESL